MMFIIFIASLHTFKKVKYLKAAIIGFSLIKIARNPGFLIQSSKSRIFMHYFDEDYVLVNLDHMIYELKDIFKNTTHIA